jgi:hypothetical protein
MQERNVPDFTFSFLDDYTIAWDGALIVGRAVFLVLCFVLAAIAFTRWRNTAENSNDRFMERTALLLDRLASLEQQIAATHTRLEGLQERIESGPQTATVTNLPAANYQIAIRLAKNGARVDDLVESCALTRQEAELVQRLHAPPRRARVA